MEQGTVLVVEDETEIRLFLRDAVLEPEGYHVLLAKDGQEGLERTLAERPNLLLLDLQMPRLSGLELLQRLRDQGATVPAIVLSIPRSGQRKNFILYFCLTMGRKNIARYIWIWWRG
jgi:DNA-binding response OmpR family regulator